ncbi:MAG: hypothetical protein K2N48_05175 [Muribaculaceae bacterium]|nr:hypothetical protein [Muribaculaceae bacterium]
MLENDHPHYFRPHIPHNCRRAKFHNYKAPGFYMITINKSTNAPIFSTLHGDIRSAENPPHTILTKAGLFINTEIQNIDNTAEFNIPNYIIMPDHIHILWQVKIWLPKDLGHYIGLFKSRCTKNWREYNHYYPNLQYISLFTPKFNDKISFDEAMTERFSRYISDNPRRRLTVMTHPELFDRAHRVRILDKEMDFYGNFQLLKHPVIAAAVVSSRYTKEEKERYEFAWEEAIRTQGVLISPFISEAEKTLMRRGIESGASIIRILPDGIGPKYKPSGQEFDLCAQGRCLHIGPLRQSSHTDPLSRSHCLSLNAIAHWIASHPTERMTLTQRKD